MQEDNERGVLTASQTAVAQREGGCLCGAVRFSGAPTDRGVGACHCGQCRRWTSGPFYAVRMQDGVDLISDHGLDWFAASEWGERGFCTRCGASLFWRMKGEARDWAVSAAALDDDSDLPFNEHIFADRAAPYFAFSDGAARRTEAECLAEEAGDSAPAASSKSGKRKRRKIESVFKGRRLKITRLPGAGRRLVMAFSGVHGKVGGIQTEEFVGSASGGGDNHVLFIQDRKRTWFNGAGLIEKIAEIAQAEVERLGVDEVVSLGTSMGGFGAVVISSVMHVDRVIAISPQYSVHPDLVPREKRWAKMRRRIKDWRFPTLEDGMVDDTRYLLLHGLLGPDANHYAQIGPRPNLMQVLTPHADHFVARMLKTQGALSPVLGAWIDGRVAEGAAVLRKSGAFVQDGAEPEGAEETRRRIAAASEVLRRRGVSRFKSKQMTPVSEPAAPTDAAAAG